MVSYNIRTQHSYWQSYIPLSHIIFKLRRDLIHQRTIVWEEERLCSSIQFSWAKGTVGRVISPLCSACAAFHADSAPWAYCLQENSMEGMQKLPPSMLLSWSESAPPPQTFKQTFPAATVWQREKQVPGPNIF